MIDLLVLILLVLVLILEITWVASAKQKIKDLSLIVLYHSYLIDKLQSEEQT